MKKYFKKFSLMCVMTLISIALFLPTSNAMAMSLTITGMSGALAPSSSGCQKTVDGNLGTFGDFSINYYIKYKLPSSIKYVKMTSSEDVNTHFACFVLDKHGKILNRHDNKIEILEKNDEINATRVNNLCINNYELSNNNAIKKRI